MLENKKKLSRSGIVTIFVYFFLNVMKCLAENVRSGLGLRYNLDIDPGTTMFEIRIKVPGPDLQL